MFQALIEYFSWPIGTLELAATVLLLINVYLLGQQKLVNYLFGFGGVFLMGFVLMANKLYSDMLLRWMFYAPLQIVGYYLWRFGRTLGDTDAPASTNSMTIVMLPTRLWPILLLGVLATAAGLGCFMATYTDASFPYIDALTTMLSIAASVLMLKKVLEDWWLWIIMDVIAIPLYFLKGLYVVSGLYVVFLGLAILGLVQWLDDYRALKTKEAVGVT
ncbi:MAG: nicotinamide riboside transporter PnuC [Pseudomonadota bacterium]